MHPINNVNNHVFISKPELSSTYRKTDSLNCIEKFKDECLVETVGYFFSRCIVNYNGDFLLK